jgi:plasmid stabilization system protein ParE
VGEPEVSFRVIWSDAALAELHNIWSNALDQEGVENTAKRIDIELTFNPREAGESRGPDRRVMFKFPLVVWFRVLDRMRDVQVLHVRQSKQA